MGVGPVSAAPRRAIFLDRDGVLNRAIVKDGKPYRNSYTWYFQMRDDKVVKAIAFFDNRDFDEFWRRVSP